MTADMTMTRIDFHSNVPDKLGYACRLVRKARAANCNIVLLMENRADLAALDERLWTFSELDFIPHVHATDPLASATPVICGRIAALAIVTFSSMARSAARAAFRSGLLA